MGIPSIYLEGPANEVALTATISTFNAIYSDSINQLAATSVVLEVDTVNSFDSADKKISTFNNVAHNKACRAVFILPVESWYWRVTAINTDGTIVSEIRFLSITQELKRTFSIYENIGKYGPDWMKKRTLSIYENIAKLNVWTKKRALYEYENITSDPPFPFLERLSTTRGAKGSIVTLYGNGFGTKPEVDAGNVDRAMRGYGGFVYLGEQICSIISWSWTKIIFQVPSDATSGAVKVSLTVPVPPGIRDSNVIGFEVYEAEPTADIGIEFFICDRNNPNTILCQLENAASKSFQMILNNPGSGKFSISRYDDKGGNRDYLADQNFILCRLDGVDRFKWIIESMRPVYVDSSEQQMIEVSGRGILSILERAVVYPDGMPSPTSLERVFTTTHGGAILRQLILEAQARGTLTGIAITWTSDEDSIGNPWTDDTDITFHAGTPLLEVLNKLSDGMGLFDIEITPSMQLKLYQKKGIDKSDLIRYFPGQAILSHENQNDTAKMTNVVLVEGESGSLVEVVHPGGQASWGRREGYLQARNIPSEWAKLENYGNLYLKKTAEVNWSIRGTVLKFVTPGGSRMVPFESYLIGDWINWDIPPEGSDTVGFDETVRVKGITVEESSDSEEVIYTLDLNNILLEHEIKVSQMVERLSMFSRDSVLSSQSTESPAGISHNHTHGLLRGLDADDHPQYFNEGRHAADLHTGIARVSGIKKAGSNVLTGEVVLKEGTNVTLTQDDAQKAITVSAGGGGATSNYYVVFSMGTSVSSRTENGYCVKFMALSKKKLKGFYIHSDWTLGVEFICKLWSEDKTVLTSKSIVGDGTLNTKKEILLDSSYELQALTTYYVSVEITTGSIKKYYTSYLDAAFVTPIQAYTGLPNGVLTAFSYPCNMGIILEI